MFVDMTVKLLDMTGREVKTLSANGKHNLTIDCQETKPGFYILQFMSEGKTANKKIIIRQ